MSLIHRGKKSICHAVLYLNGKQKWVSLKTADRKVAKIKQASLVKEFTDHDPLKPISWPDFCKIYLEYARTNKRVSGKTFDPVAIKRFNQDCLISSLTEFTPTLFENGRTLILRGTS